MAGLTRWDPFADITALHEQMNRMLDERLFRPRRETSLAHWSPAVDIYEDAEGITIQAEVPGVEPDQIEVKVEDDTLSISGKRTLEREEKKENYHRVERAYGSFLRTFSLPPTVDTEKIRAENRNGVLSVFLPKKEETRPRKIQVKVH